MSAKPPVFVDPPPSLLSWDNILDVKHYQPEKSAHLYYPRTEHVKKAIQAHPEQVEEEEVLVLLEQPLSNSNKEQWMFRLPYRTYRINSPKQQQPHLPYPPNSSPKKCSGTSKHTNRRIMQGITGTILHYRRKTRSIPSSPHTLLVKKKKTTTSHECWNDSAAGIDWYNTVDRCWHTVQAHYNTKYYHTHSRTGRQTGRLKPSKRNKIFHLHFFNMIFVPVLCCSCTVPVPAPGDYPPPRPFVLPYFTFSWASK